MHCRMTIENETSRNDANNIPTTKPKFTNNKRLFTKLYYVSLHAKRNPRINKNLPKEKFTAKLNTKNVMSYGRRQDSLCYRVKK